MPSCLYGRTKCKSFQKEVTLARLTQDPSLTQARISEGKMPTAKITVVIATHNRADVLDTTLRKMASLITANIETNWVIVDNNSTDHTQSIIELHSRTLRITSLFERRPGKNSAINLALSQATLADIVLFTDDDVTPEIDWLQEVARSCTEWPRHSVFGGKILPSWPTHPPPRWTQEPGILDFGFSYHDQGSTPKLYENNLRPYGPNMWVRRAVFDAGFRFPEHVGPRPKNRIMGSETVFLLELAKHGYDAFYYPGSIVHHRIDEAALSESQIVKRAFRCGRGAIHGHQSHRSILGLIGGIPANLIRWATTINRMGEPKCVARRVYVSSQAGQLYEKIRLALGQ